MNEPEELLSSSSMDALPLDVIFEQFDYATNTLKNKTILEYSCELLVTMNFLSLLDPQIFVFMLTTRVDGLGLNLVGASRIILYDPDWNPSTDNQAKERIQRIGQIRNVEIYRLITRNTIDVKVYQKQIYKDCLSRKIRYDPGTRIAKDAILDLFSYPEMTADNVLLMEEQQLEIVEDKLVDIKNEDITDFSKMKSYNEKIYLNGNQLIDYIIRRELNLE
jgi:DNA excision repair protein ERCC-6